MTIISIYYDMDMQLAHCGRWSYLVDIMRHIKDMH